MAYDVAHLPTLTGAGGVLRLYGERVQVLRELLCCGLAKLDTVLKSIHGVLLCMFVSPRRHADFCPREGRTPRVRRER